MTRTRSNRGRRRGRGRPPEAHPEQASQSAPAQEAAPESPAPRRRPERAPASDDDSARESGGQQASRARQGGRGPQGEGGQSPRGGRSGRRRQQRRPQITPAAGEVIRRNAPVTGVSEPLAKRTLDQLGPGEPVLGCPMLSRTQLGLPVAGGRQAPRCSLAWALRSEEEASYCLETPDLTQCWKAHPERLAEIRARIAERAAD